MSACPKCHAPVAGRPNFCPACGASLTFSVRTDHDPLLGRVIGGNYKVESLIGEGAMGRVYQATHIQLRNKVALKILRSNLVDDATVVKRFQREAQAASRLNHPNCISIYGFGEEDDGELLWMAMEYIQGRDLGRIINEDAPLPAVRIVHIIRQVCEALDEAHASNIIHRDLKPANVVCFDHRRTKDFVKVLDFGIAKITDPGEDYQPLTRDGIVCGTPAYMSPEQVQGFELDPRSDLFSLGIILYQTMTARLPFYAESAVEVATKIVIEDPVPPSKVRPDWSYPPELEAVVMKLLSKKREERFPNAIEVRDALDRCMETLKARQDASLEMNPDEVAELLADRGGPVEGAATLRLSTDMIAKAMAAEGLVGLGKPKAAPARPSTAPSTTPPARAAEAPASPPSRPIPVTPATESSPSTAAEASPPRNTGRSDVLRPPAIMTGPTTAFRETQKSSRSAGLLVGVAVFVVAGLGVGAWFLLR